jgi:hypothetical protein
MVSLNGLKKIDLITIKNIQMETKIIEVNLGVGMDQLFPRPVKIIIENDNNQEDNSDEESTNLNNQ